ncbi:MAG: hypothetical protein K5662_05705 [Lachnospiraceae bacterium]|nr:hypothetical protein [Lachnospiraceae bacterium]
MYSNDNLSFRKSAICSKCGKPLHYKGLGEYECSCGNIEYDDYGAVRAFLETCPGADITTTSKMTGVSKEAIRDMVKNGQFTFHSNK